MTDQTMLATFNENFARASAHASLTSGMAEQIKTCNSLYSMAFPVEVDGEVQVIRAYRAEHFSYHQLPVK
ncbi:MAG: hypothetical protein R3C68_00690 [Myxococcota bacterium]